MNNTEKEDLAQLVQISKSQPKMRQAEAIGIPKNLNLAILKLPKSVVAQSRELALQWIRENFLRDNSKLARFLNKKMKIFGPKQEEIILEARLRLDKEVAEGGVGIGN